MATEYISLIILLIAAISAVLAMLCIAHKRIRETLFDLLVMFFVFLGSLLVTLRSAFKPKNEELPPS